MDDVITLIKDGAITYDSNGNEVVKRSERTVMCQIFGVTRSEFYSAATAGMHPELVARLSDIADYEGEKLARYSGDLYSIIRVYRDRGSVGGRQNASDMSPNAVELTLERKIGNVEIPDKNTDSGS